MGGCPPDAVAGLGKDASSAPRGRERERFAMIRARYNVVLCACVCCTVRLARVTASSRRAVSSRERRADGAGPVKNASRATTIQTPAASLSLVATETRRSRSRTYARAGETPLGGGVFGDSGVGVAHHGDEEVEEDDGSEHGGGGEEEEEDDGGASGVSRDVGFETAVGEPFETRQDLGVEVDEGAVGGWAEDAHVKAVEKERTKMARMNANGRTSFSTISYVMMMK